LLWSTDEFPAGYGRSILIHVEQRVFGIVREKSKTVRTDPVSEPALIIGTIVSKKVRDRRVEVASIENHQHVVDEMEHRGDCLRGLRVPSDCFLNTLVSCIVGDARLHEIISLVRRSYCHQSR
jgi:hypothetical protein